MGKVLITGGAGFVGVHLAASLSREDNQVTLIDNFKRGERDKDLKKLLDRENVELVTGDITQRDMFDDLPSNFDYVYHLAAVNGTENFYNIPAQVLKVGTIGTLNVIDWFMGQRRGKLLFSSSSETYSGTSNLMGNAFPIPTPEEISLTVEDPENVRWSYGLGKIVGEVALHSHKKENGLENFVIVRYHNIYGPRMGNGHVIPQMIERLTKKENPFKIFGAEETRTFCYIDDTIKATRMIMESKDTNGLTYNIGNSDEEIKIKNLAKKLFDIAKIHPQTEIIDSPEGSVKRRCPDTTKLKNLRFSPRVSLEEGLEKTYNWYIENGRE